MVLEAIIDPDLASSSPWSVAVLGFIFVTVAVFSAGYLITGSTSLLVVALVAIPSVTLMTNIFDREANFDYDNSKNTLTRYLPIILVLGSYFLGVMAGFTLYYVFLPHDQTAVLFAQQTDELTSITSAVSGYVVQSTYNGDLAGAFEFLFMNNLKVFMILLLGALMYGAGTIFILDWNASVIGVFIGNVALGLVRNQPAQYTIWSGIGSGIMNLLPHGTFELLAYFCIAIAGGIISEALLHKKYRDPEFIVIIYDVTKLFAWGLLFLAAGAFIEGTALSGG
jgi:uncharacterized membrane protein SpoIIM required for sporulation